MFKLSLNGRRHNANLQQRFIAVVLAPPFLILLVLGALGLWQLDRFVSAQAVNELERSASTTAAKLEREFALRHTVLKRTGEELFVIKSNYQADRKELDANRAACRTFVKERKTFVGAPGGECDPFLTYFASKGAGSLAAIEDGYVARGEQLTHDQNQRINDRLAAFKQFFPETLALVVVDEKKQLVSSALSDVFKGSPDQLLPDAIAALDKPLEVKVSSAGGFRLATFAYPITGGSVLAAYDLASDSFIKETWASTPINQGKALAVILDSTGQTVYPGLAFNDEFKSANSSLRNKSYIDLKLKDISHISVGAETEGSNWLVAVASPKAVVFGPVRDAQLAAVLIIGLLLLGLLWVGAYFIRRTVGNIMQLVSGALVFASGKLDHKIQLRHSDREFEQLAETLNSMAGRIASTEKEIDVKNKEFISIATHELRTPLTAIMGNLSMVSEDYSDQLSDTVKPMVQQALNGTTRLRGLVNDMLDMARLEGGRVEFVIAPQDIKSMAADVVETLRVTANEKPVNLVYADTGAQPVLADSSKLRIILNNFVSNAIKYNRPDGSVTVSHSVKDGQLTTAIADTGLGIPEDQKAHMFEKFFRVANADRANVVGTGLGMYITKQYVLAMGGKVWFESVHGQGTTFYFSLPLAPSTAQIPLQSPSPPDPVIVAV